MKQGALQLRDSARWAILSDDGAYRYVLARGWRGGKKYVLFVLLNPSTADAFDDDPTVRKCRGFARRWGFGNMLIANLYAWRATDSSALGTAADPIGPDNDEKLRRSASIASAVVCGWGNCPTGIARDAFDRRAADVLRILSGNKPWCIAQNKTGHPAHPLYLPYTDAPIDLNVARWAAL